MSRQRASRGCEWRGDGIYFLRVSGSLRLRGGVPLSKRQQQAWKAYRTCRVQQKGSRRIKRARATMNVPHHRKYHTLSKEDLHVVSSTVYGPVRPIPRAEERRTPATELDATEEHICQS